MIWLPVCADFLFHLWFHRSSCTVSFLRKFPVVPRKHLICTLLWHPVAVSWLLVLSNRPNSIDNGLLFLFCTLAHHQYHIRFNYRMYLYEDLQELCVLLVNWLEAMLFFLSPNLAMLQIWSFKKKGKKLESLVFSLHSTLNSRPLMLTTAVKVFGWDSPSSADQLSFNCMSQNKY